MKDIILTDDSGTCLYQLTSVTSKQLLSFDAGSIPFGAFIMEGYYDYFNRGDYKRRA